MLFESNPTGTGVSVTVFLCAPGPAVPRLERTGHRGRQFEGEYLNLCLDHVREYNRDYNFFQGLDDAAVSSFQKDAEPAIAPRGGLARIPGPAARSVRKAPPGGFRRHAAHDDPFELFSDTPGRRPSQAARPVRNAERKALHSLGLDEAATSDQVKSRYKTLVKRLHPDANGGSRDNEDKLKEVIQAYDYLCTCGFC